MKSYFSLLAFLLGVSLTLQAQPQLKLSAMRHDFGSIIWKQPVKTVFSITNSGSSDLVIEEVHPDCGCTIAEWPKEHIRPGETGDITVTFDAELLGRFRKQLAVRTNENPQPFYLTVSGDVVREKKDYSKNYAFRIGDIYMDTDNVEFEDVRKGDTPYRTLTLFNAGRQSYKPQLMHLPKYLKVVCEPQHIRPKHEGVVKLYLDTEQLRTLGLNQTNIYLSRFPGDCISHENEILCSAILLPELDMSAEEMLRAPVLQIDSTQLHFQRLEGKKQKRKVVIVNTGKSDLVFSALQVSHPGVRASLGKSRLKPGAKTTLKVAISEDNSHFKGRSRVLLITNDPQHPKVTIDIFVKK